MSRVKASMADVSTDFSPLDPGVHLYEIEEVETIEDNETQKIQYAITNKVIALVDGGREEDIGRKIVDRIYLHAATKKNEDGTPKLNEFAVAQLKRYFEVTLGEERANDPEADTDWLKGQRFLGQTEIETYQVDDKLTGKKETRKKNKIARLAPTSSR